ncbi:Ig-like domain-containing protein, partial [Planctomycetota bacterium]
TTDHSDDAQAFSASEVTSFQFHGQEGHDTLDDATGLSDATGHSHHRMSYGEPGSATLTDGVLRYVAAGVQPEDVSLSRVGNSQVRLTISQNGETVTHRFATKKVASFEFAGKSINDRFVNETEIESTMLFGSSMMGGGEDAKMQLEMEAAFRLVDDAFATNVTVQSGNWSDPATWGGAEKVPVAGARIVVADGHEVTIDGVFADTFMTIRVDGTMRFATDVDTELRVDTLVTGPGSTFEMGTAEAPIAKGVTARIVIDDYNDGFETEDRNSPDYDPMQLGQGVISHGRFVMHGQEKTSYATINGALAGDTSIVLDNLPIDWQVGDTVVIAGTKRLGAVTERLESEETLSHEDVRTIAAIDSATNTVLFDEPLAKDHTTPPHSREGLALKVHVANTTRNASIETAEEHRDFTSQEVISRHPLGGYSHQGRGHVMFMHSNDVQVRYGGFYHLGRTNKGGRQLDDTMLDEHGDVTSVGTNQRARYSLHFHRAGVAGAPGIVHGSSVVDSVGWGYVNHGSHAVFTNNVAYDVDGAAYVTERGDETGLFAHNLSIKNVSLGLGERGGFGAEKAVGPNVNNFGVRGHGIWSQGPLVRWRDNIISGAMDAIGMKHIAFDGGSEGVKAQGFTQRVHEIKFVENVGSTVYGSGKTMTFSIYHPGRGKKEVTDFHDFLVWNVTRGFSAGYSSGMRLQNLVMIGDPADPGEYGVWKSIPLLGGGHIEGFIRGYVPGWGSTNGTKGRGIDGYFLKNFINIDATVGNNHNDRPDIRIRNITFETPEEQYLPLMRERVGETVSFLPDDSEAALEGELVSIDVPITEPTNILGRFQHVSDRNGVNMSFRWLLPKRMSVELEVDGKLGIYEVMLKEMQDPDFVLYPEEMNYDKMPKLFQGWTNEQWNDVSSSTMTNGKWRRPDGSKVNWFNYSNTKRVKEGYSGKDWLLDKMQPTLERNSQHDEFTARNKHDTGFPGWQLTARGFMLPRDWQSRDEYVDGDRVGFDGIVLKRLGDVTWDDVRLQLNDDFISTITDNSAVELGKLKFTDSLVYKNDVNVDVHLVPETSSANRDGTTQIDGGMEPQYGQLNSFGGGRAYVPAEGFYGTDSYRYHFIQATGHDSWGQVYIHVPGGEYDLNGVEWQAGHHPAPGIQMVGDRAEIHFDLPAILANNNPGFAYDSIVSVGEPLREQGTVQRDGDVVSYAFGAEPAKNKADGVHVVVSDTHGAERRLTLYVRPYSEKVDRVTTRRYDINVAFWNLNPVVEDINHGFSARRGETAVIDVLSRASDPEQMALSVYDVKQPNLGSATVENGQLLYSANGDFEGRALVEYRVADAEGGLSHWLQAYVDVTKPTSDPAAPTAGDLSVSTVEDSSLSINLLANAHDASGETLRIDGIGMTDHGTVVLQSDGTVIYTPDADYNGSDHLFYTVTNEQGGRAFSSVEITVVPDNDAPRPLDDSTLAFPGVARVIDVLANDSDIEGETLSVASVSQGQHGTTTITVDGLVHYVANTDFEGTDSFTYTVRDSSGLATDATVDVQVSSMPRDGLLGHWKFENLADGVVLDSSGQDNHGTVADSFTTSEGVSGQSITTESRTAVVLPASTFESIGEQLTISFWTNQEMNKTNGIFSAWSSDGTKLMTGQLRKGALIWDSADSTGTDRLTGGTPAFSLRVGLWTHWVFAKDAASNEMRIYMNGERVASRSDTSYGIGDIAEFHVAPSYSEMVDEVSIHSRMLTDAEISRMASAREAGNNLLPIAVADVAMTDQGESVHIDVLANDSDPDGQALALVDAMPGINGTTRIVDNEAIVYTPNPGFSGEDSFAYIVSDGHGGNARTTVNVTVTSSGLVNLAPIASDDNAETDEDHTVRIDVLGNDSDADGDVISVLSATA